MNAATGQAIGVFGGTFDPVHIGHLRAAQEVLEQLDIADFRFVPAGDPPHRNVAVTLARHRLAMLQLALAGHPRFRIDDREMRRNGPSYMVDTLRDLRTEAPGSPLLVVMGQDSANTLDTWHRWQEIFQLAHLVIMQRPDHAGTFSPALAEVMARRTVTSAASLLRETHGGILGLRVMQIPVSSSAIRKMIRSGRSPRFLVTGAVLKYIEARVLYS